MLVVFFFLGGEGFGRACSGKGGCTRGKRVLEFRLGGCLRDFEETKWCQQGQRGKI